MKKRFSWILALALIIPCVFIFSACGGDGEQGGDEGEDGGNSSYPVAVSIEDYPFGEEKNGIRLCCFEPEGTFSQDDPTGKIYNIGSKRRIIVGFSFEFGILPNSEGAFGVYFSKDDSISADDVKLTVMAKSDYRNDFKNPLTGESIGVDEYLNLFNRERVVYYEVSGGLENGNYRLLADVDNLVEKEFRIAIEVPEVPASENVNYAKLYIHDDDALRVEDEWIPLTRLPGKTYTYFTSTFSDRTKIKYEWIERDGSNSSYYMSDLIPLNPANNLYMSASPSYNNYGDEICVEGVQGSYRTFSKIYSFNSFNMDTPMELGEPVDYYVMKFSTPSQDILYEDICCYSSLVCSFSPCTEDGLDYRSDDMEDGKWSNSVVFINGCEYFQRLKSDEKAYLRLDGRTYDSNVNPCDVSDAVVTALNKKTGTRTILPIVEGTTNVYEITNHLGSVNLIYATGVKDSEGNDFETRTITVKYYDDSETPVEITDKINASFRVYKSTSRDPKPETFEVNYGMSTDMKSFLTLYDNDCMDNYYWGFQFNFPSNYDSSNVKYKFGGADIRTLYNYRFGYSMNDRRQIQGDITIEISGLKRLGVELSTNIEGLKMAYLGEDGLYHEYTSGTFVFAPRATFKLKNTGDVELDDLAIKLGNDSSMPLSKENYYLRDQWGEPIDFDEDDYIIIVIDEIGKFEIIDEY